MRIIKATGEHASPGPLQQQKQRCRQRQQAQQRQQELGACLHCTLSDPALAWHSVSRCTLCPARGSDFGKDGCSYACGFVSLIIYKVRQQLFVGKETIDFLLRDSLHLRTIVVPQTSVSTAGWSPICARTWVRCFTYCLMTARGAGPTGLSVQHGAGHREPQSVEHPATVR